MNFLRKAFSPILLIISFLVLIYVFYKSEIFYEGDKRNYYFIYYIISLILILFSFITFFFNKKIKEYLIISTISLFISIYSFEGYLTFKKNTKYLIYERQSGDKWDTRTVFKIYNDLKKINNQIVVSINATLYETENYSIHSLAGVSNSETIFCNENGYYSIYQSDRFGFNNPNEEWDSDEIEYLLVGDSFTHGSCVNRPNDIGSVLRTLSNKSVLNLGIRGNGPLSQYATLREYLNTKVKKVLWVYSPNDFYDLTSEKKKKILLKYFNDISFSQNLRLKQDIIDENSKKFIVKSEKIHEEALLKFGKNEKLKKFIKFYNLRILFLGYKAEVPSASLHDFKKVLEKAQKITKKNDSELFVIILPHYSRYIKVRNKSSLKKNYSEIKSIVNDLKIPFIDIHKEVFEKEKNPLKFFPFEQNGHYNVDGYRKIGQEIYYRTND